MRVAALVLAAGCSSRMGRNNDMHKALANVGGSPMICRVVDAALGSSCCGVTVVTGANAASIESGLGGREVMFAHN